MAIAARYAPWVRVGSQGTHPASANDTDGRLVKAGAEVGQAGSTGGINGQKRLGLCPDNPCDLSEFPLVENTRDVRFLHYGEWSILRQCIRRDVQQIADTMLMTAARWGEISAIQVGDCLVSSEDVINIQLQRRFR